MKGIADGHEKAFLIGNHSVGKTNKFLSHISVKWGKKSHNKIHLFKE